MRELGDFLRVSKGVVQERICRSGVVVSAEESIVVEDCVRICSAVQNGTLDLDSRLLGAGQSCWKNLMDCFGFSFSQSVTDYLSNLQPFNLQRVLDSCRKYFVVVGAKIVLRVSVGSSVVVQCRGCSVSGSVVSVHSAFPKNCILVLSDNESVYRAGSNPAKPLPVGCSGIGKVILYSGLCEMKGNFEMTVVGDHLVKVDTAKLDKLFLF